MSVFDRKGFVLPLQPSRVGSVGLGVLSKKDRYRGSVQMAVSNIRVVSAVNPFFSSIVSDF